MDNKTYSVWNPLEFLGEAASLDILDLDEIHHLGQRTLQIATEQHVELSYQGSKIVGREVGDDRVDLCRHVDPLCATLAVQEDVIRMVTSPEDTSIRKRSWNFCEVTSGPLTDPHQGFDYIRKEGNFENLGFNDSVVLRIILDVQKGEGEEHSSTQPGKMSMLGSRLATPRRENRGYWMLASLFQDSMLATHKASEPKYLPPVMGGTGVTALFDNPNNVFLYTLAYKGGKYRRIYATAVAEMRSYLYNLERGLQSAPILCPRLREKQEYFWGTYHNMVFIPESITVGDRDRPPEPLYKATGGQNRYQAFENRLLRTRHVVTRKQASVEWMHSRRLRHIFLGLFPTMKEFEDLDLVQSRTLRAKYNNALNANSALQNLLQKKASASDVRQMTGDRNFRLLTVGKLDFTRDDALWVFLNGQGENYSLRDVTLSEDIFVRGEVSIEETFKVGGIRLRPYLSSGAKEQLTKTKIGLYQINKPMEEWAEDLLSRLIIKRDELHRPLDPTEVGPIFDQDREWVNDDSGLVATCLRDTCDSKATHSVLLVSSDRRLANQMAETCNVNVIRLSPHEFVKIAHSEGKEISSEADCNFLKGKYNLTFDYGYVDTGSLHASACHYMEEDGKLYHRTLLSTGWEGETRYSKSTLSLAEKVRIKKELHRPVTRPRKWSHGSRPYESVYSSHSSWKQSVRSQRSELSNWWRPCGRIPER